MVLALSVTFDTMIVFWGVFQTWVWLACAAVDAVLQDAVQQDVGGGAGGLLLEPLAPETWNSTGFGS